MDERAEYQGTVEQSGYIVRIGHPRLQERER